MSKPAGVQIKRWFLTLVLLLLVVNIISVASLYVVYTKIDDIKAAYQPVMNSSSIINENIMTAQLDLYKYLSDYQDNLSPVYASTGNLTKELKEINRIVVEKSITLDVNQLNEILDSTQRFEKAIKQLETVNEKSGTVDWDKVNELRRSAVESGTEAFNKAKAVNNDVNLLITKHNIRVTLIALIVVCVLFIFLIVSVIIMIQLLYWWRKFEDLILEL